MSKKKIGRPSLYSEELVARICQERSEGKSLRKICEADDMPHRKTVMEWLTIRQDFSDQYARAREAWADLLFDECLEIADAASNENANVAKLRVDTRKWAAGKLNPKRYGDKVQNEHTGADGAQLVINIVRFDGSHQSAQQVDPPRIPTSRLALS